MADESTANADTKPDKPSAIVKAKKKPTDVQGDATVDEEKARKPAGDEGDAADAEKARGAPTDEGDDNPDDEEVYEPYAVAAE